MLYTSPDRLQAEFGSADSVLSKMAELARHRNGILGYESGPSSDDPVWVRDCIRLWGSQMSGCDGAADNYLSNGYLLLVGETEIVPAWTVDTPDRDWSSGEETRVVSLADLPYGDVLGSDNSPDLITGRIIGDTSGELVAAMQASLNTIDGAAFDRSFGLATSGSEGDWENFVGRARDMQDVWLDEQADGTAMADGARLHHWSAHVHKEQMVSGYDFPTDAGDALLLADLDGIGRVEAVLIDPGDDTAHVAMHDALGLEHSDFYREFECPFDRGDALASGDIDGDGADEIVVGSIGTDQIIIGYDPPHTGIGTHPEFPVVLEPWDVVVCGDVSGDAGEEILVARRTDGGRVDVYHYDNSAGPTLTWLRRFSVPFTAWDGFAVGDVNATNAGPEIIVGRDDDDRIYIYDAVGTAIADIPCDPYTGYDAMAVGDLDGDGADEIVVVIDDTVDSKRRLKLFQNDGWTWDANDGWIFRRDGAHTIYSRFLHFDGVRTTASESGDDNLVAGDINGDGVEELCLARENDDRLYVLDANYKAGWRDRFMSFIQSIDDRIDVFAMTGHGNTDSCSPYVLADVGGFALAAHPLVYALSCLTGNYEGEWWWINADGARETTINGDSGFAEAFFGSGAAAYIGATEVSPSTQNTEAGPGLLRGWSPDETAGKALRDYKRDRVGRDDWWRFWCTEYNYYGDPKFGAIGTTEGAAPDGSGPKDAKSRTEGAAQPPASQYDLSIPEYQVAVDGDWHRVTIPGGDILMEAGKPMVPYYTMKVELPAPYVVQDVVLLSKTGLTTAEGLTLAPAIMAPDGAEGDPAQQSGSGEEWYPDRDYDWYVITNGDGSSTLVVMVYPFFYNSLTTAVNFYRNYSFRVDYSASTVSIVSLATDKNLYQPGQTVHVDLAVHNSGDAQDVIVNAVVKRYGSDEVLDGLLLRMLKGMVGSVSFTPQWDSTNCTPGYCCVEVTLSDLQGNLLDKDSELFALGSSSGRITSFSATPEYARAGDDVDIDLTFENNGPVDITGLARIEVIEPNGASVAILFGTAFACEWVVGGGRKIL